MIRRKFGRTGIAVLPAWPAVRAQLRFRTLARFWVFIRIYGWAGPVCDEYIGFEVFDGPT